MLLIFFLFWLIISARLDAETGVFGAIISTLVYLFVRSHMHYKAASVGKILFNLLRGFKYAGILVWETAKASVGVLRIVYSRSISIRPQLIFFRPNLKTNTAKVVLANSITLTPGTITAEIDNGLYCIHCLDKEIGDGIDDSTFIRQLLKFEE